MYRNSPEELGELKDRIKQTINDNPEAAALRIVGLVGESNDKWVREVALEIGHEWPPKRQAYKPVNRATGYKHKDRHFG